MQSISPISGQQGFSFFSFHCWLMQQILFSPKKYYPPSCIYRSIAIPFPLQATGWVFVFFFLSTQTQRMWHEVYLLRLATANTNREVLNISSDHFFCTLLFIRCLHMLIKHALSTAWGAQALRSRPVLSGPRRRQRCRGALPHRLPASACLSNNDCHM